MIHLKTTGIILRITPYREFDKCFVLLSPDMGLVSVIAKGIRKIHSTRGCYVDLLNFVRVELECSGACGSPQNFRYLREISSIENFKDLKESAALPYAYIIARFLLSILPLPSPSQHYLFDITYSALDRLERTENPLTLLTTYLLKVNRLLGLIPPHIAKNRINATLRSTLHSLSPQFALQARRMLGIFSSLDKIRSN